MKRLVHLALALSTTSFIAAEAPLEPPKQADDAIDRNGLLEHIKILGSDKFEGRAPGSKGEKESVSYIIEQFKQLGLKPGNPNGTYTQEVPLAGLLATPAAAFTVGTQRIELHSPSEFVAFTQRITPEIEVKNSDVVFVGYSVVAPEYGWDDFKGVDVKGKTLVMLINDPAIPDTVDPKKLDEKIFKGRGMTYSGRWTFK